METHERREDLLRPSGVEGRIGTFAAVCAAVAAVPLPWLPEAMAQRIRGSLAHDVAARHGVSLSAQARKVLSESSRRSAASGLSAYALRFLASALLARIGPLAVVVPLQSAVSTLALGHLLDHYFSAIRTERRVRVEEAEALRIREAIDTALRRIVLTHAPMVPSHAPPPDDRRDSMTRALDGVLSAVAGGPEWILRRLDAAFDEALAASGARSP